VLDVAPSHVALDACERDIIRVAPFLPQRDKCCEDAFGVLYSGENASGEAAFFSPSTSRISLCSPGVLVSISRKAYVT